jgi:hypothetical protein
MENASETLLTLERAAKALGKHIKIELAAPIKVSNRWFVTLPSHSFANARSVTMASFRRHDPHQWQAQVRKKGRPLQTDTFDTRGRRIHHAERANY